jgi:hypothetical protein
MHSSQNGTGQSIQGELWKWLFSILGKFQFEKYTNTISKTNLKQEYMG